ncbi:MAG: Ribonuclease protein component [Patescibacteria group bacterium]|nr:Ribonuclease protein component [Patescibacteria group bacterium]
MLPRSHRISADQFPAVTRGKSFLGEHLRVVIKTDPTLRNPKCAVIVSNKVAKTAVARNRIRRQVYAVLGEFIAKLPNAYVSVFPNKVPLEHEEILKDLKQVFK